MHDEARYVRSIAPPRMTWLPGQKPTGPLFVYREAQEADRETVRQSLQDRVGDAIFDRVWKGAAGVVRLATRNLRTMAGYAVSWHTPDLNEIHAAYVHPRYLSTRCLYDLLLLARLECPEAPSRLWVPETDDAVLKTVKSLGGWVASYDDGSIRFDRGPIARGIAEGGVAAPPGGAVDAG